MKIIYCLSLFLALLNCNCKPGITYEPAMFADTLQQEITILNDTFIMDGATGLFTYKDFLIVNTIVNDFHFHLFNKHTGLYLKSFCSIGRGPGEIVQTGPKSLNQENGNLLIICLNESRAVIYNIDSIINSENLYYKNISLRHTTPFAVEALYQHGDNKFFISSSNADCRFIKMDTAREITEIYAKFPDTDIGPFPKNTYSVFSAKTFSPDGSKYAEGSKRGAILETLNFQDSITEIAVKRFHKPIFTKKRGRISSPENCTRGFYDMTASDERIYGIYLGDHHYYWHKNIGIFDWYGNPITLLKTKYNLERICLDTETNRIYAAATDADNQTILIYFNL